MRFKLLLSVFSILLLVGSIDARPSKLASPDITEENDEKSFKKVSADGSSMWRPIEPRSSSSVTRTDSRVELKDLQYMDQSLRTVATQLLNVTNPNESKDPIENKKKTNSEKVLPNVSLMTHNNNNNNEKTNFNPPRFSSNVRSDVKLVNDVNSDLSPLGSTVGSFGRPVNSKFGYFEISHPGEAMAMTEEELERELMGGSSTKLMTAHKNHPTTTGGISTWILLNSPTTTGKSIIDEKTNDDNVVRVKVQLQNKLTTPVETPETTVKTEVKTASTVEKGSSPQTTTPMERITTITKSTTQSLKKTTAYPMTTTTERTTVPTKTTLKIEKTTVTSIPKSSIVTEPSVETAKPADPTTTLRTIVTTKKILDANRSTLRSKITTPKPINVTSKPMGTKTLRPFSQSTKSKISPSRKNSTKSPFETTKNPHTSKIEKVTFRPVQMITTPKSIHNQSNVEKPFFLTKVKTSFTADSNAIPVQSSPTNGTSSNKNETKSTLSDIEISPIPSKTKKPAKTNTVLKVQLKKPVELPTNIEIEPIRVNAPVLRIEKIDAEEKPSTRKNSTKTAAPLFPIDSRIDVQFDFNPGVTKIETETQTPVNSMATTTKRPHKRKKNKLRRRKPTTESAVSLMTSQATSAPIVASSSSLSTSTESLEAVTQVGIVDNALQESKIAPESKVTSGTGNGTKNKKKQVQKPIGTQIYNFLSREVMPSFGVMSLVGLGLGLASYFLYPFSGGIARRNYVVEPNYKYNMEEYGGSFGQNEEDVFSKVLQGMTNQDGKYGGIKDYENNFYRYQQAYDHSYPDVKHPATRRVPDVSRYPKDKVNHPLDTNVHGNEKYRNTEFKYPELSTTPNQYERPKKPDFVGKKSGDRQFVVGNIPKEYGYDNVANAATTLPVTTENLSNNFYQQYNYKFPADSADVSPSYGHAEALKSNDDYEEIETPSAVQVEHGPRALNDVPKKLRRRKRESVIQVIPSRTEIEKEEKEIEKEEPLSNEILDIIDSVIPGQKYDKDTMNNLQYSVHDEVQASTKKASENHSTNDRLDKITIIEQTTLATPKIDEKIDDAKKTSPTFEKSTEPMEKMTESPMEATAMGSTDSDLSPTSSTTTTTVKTLTIDEIIGTKSPSDGNSSESSSDEWLDSTTVQPQQERFNLFSFVKKIAEVKLKLGVAVLKHASEGFARYLGHLQKRINGEE